MSEKVVIYTTLDTAANHVIDALRREGFHPGRADDVDQSQFHVGGTTEPYYHRRGNWARNVHITVPREEAEYAKSFLRKWDARCEEDVVELTRGLGKALWVSLAMAVAVGVAVGACGAGIENAALVVIGVWIAAFVVLANVYRARSAADKGQAGR